MRKNASDTKVSELNDASLCEENVLRLKISMKDLLVVCVLEG